MSACIAGERAIPAHGLIIAAPQSGSGKTIVTLGLLAALAAEGVPVRAAKTGPDYIDTTILDRAAPAVTLDPWAMSPDRLKQLAAGHATADGMLVVEGVMGLFDGAADGRGATADLAEILGLPVVLVVDAARQSQSVAALVYGFAHFRPAVRVAGVILNNVASPRHGQMLARALAPVGLPLVGMLPRQPDLALPSRHLGLVLPDDVARFDAVLARAAASVTAHVDLAALRKLAAPLPVPGVEAPRLAPLGQNIAIARDTAFAFTYAHMLADWRAAGATLNFFSPLADEAPPLSVDAIFLPGGYPELHAATIAAAARFKAGLATAAARGALIYGECGGYMVLGEGLVDGDGHRHEMANLLPISTDFSKPRRHLGYRHLRHLSPLPWPTRLNGHEFHYASQTAEGAAQPLFAATSADGEMQPPMGAQVGRIMGSWAHVIDGPDIGLTGPTA